MESSSNKIHASNIVAATILGVSLIASALIIAPRPRPKGAENPPLPPGARPLAPPPLQQESVRTQFRDQVLAAPTVHTYKTTGKEFTVSDIQVDQVIYNAKDDTFYIRFRWLWEPSQPPTHDWHHWSDGTTLSNDGYGHYYGTVVLSPIDGGTGQNADVTIK